MDVTKLTPVRVRGKRTQAKQQPQNQMKRPAEIALSREKHRRRMANVPVTNPTNAMKPRSLSRLENLPAEIIEEIFALALTPALAEASPFIGRVVSSERMYRVFVMFAFFEENRWPPVREDVHEHWMNSWWNRHPGYKDSVEQTHVDNRLFLPIEYKPIDLRDRIILQQQIMCRRWLTLSRLQAILPHLLAATYMQRVRLQKDLKQYCATAPRAVEGVEDVPEDAPVVRFNTGRYVGTLPFRMPVLEMGYRDEMDHEHRRDRSFRLYFWHPGIYCHIHHIPDKVLSECVSSSEDLQYLTLLVEMALDYKLKGGKTYFLPKRKDLSLSEPLLARSLEQAVREGNIQALRILCIILSVFIPIWPSRRETTRLPPSSSSYAECFPHQTSPHPKILSPRVYRLAATTTPDLLQLPVLRLLCLSAFSYLTIPRSDAALTKWAVRKPHLSSSSSTSSGDEDDGGMKFAKDLLSYMEDGRVEVLGEIWGPVLEGGYQFSSETGIEEFVTAHDDDGDQEEEGMEGTGRRIDYFQFDSKSLVEEYYRND